MDAIERRFLTIWAAMAALTVSSYFASESWINHAVIGIASIIGIALIKVRFVLLDFMEIRSSPIALRLVLEAWMIGLATALVLLCQ